MLGFADGSLADPPGREVIRLPADNAFVRNAPLFGRFARPLFGALDRFGVALLAPVLEPGPDSHGPESTTQPFSAKLTATATKASVTLPITTRPL